MRYTRHLQLYTSASLLIFFYYEVESLPTIAILNSGTILRNDREIKLGQGFLKFPTFC